MTSKRIFNFGKYTFICWNWTKKERYDLRGNLIEEPTLGHSVMAKQFIER